MKPRFNESKTAQIAGVLLEMRAAPMHYMKLIKLMYLVDRAALIMWGRPLTYDNYVSMPHGPVLSATLDLINEGPDGESPWHQQIERATDPYCVRLKARPQTTELSEAEKNLIAKIFERYGRMNRYDLRDLLHKVLPEWQDPKGSSLPITYRDILRAAGKSESEITQILSEIEKASA
jgi:uncharacterized phage-associated protein